MTPVLLWSAALFLLALSPDGRGMRPLTRLRPAAACLLVLLSLPWLGELVAVALPAGLPLVPLLVLAAALGEQNDWPARLGSGILLGCASGLAGLLLATGIAGSVDHLWERLAARDTDLAWVGTLHGPVRSGGAAFALLASYTLLLATMRMEGRLPGPPGLLHGTVVAAGLTTVAQGPVQVLAFWAIVAAHAFAGAALALPPLVARAIADGKTGRVLAGLVVLLVTFGVLEVLS